MRVVVKVQWMLCAVFMWAACSQSRLIHDGGEPTPVGAPSAALEPAVVPPAVADTQYAPPVAADHRSGVKRKLARALLTYLDSPGPAVLAPLDQYAAMPRSPDEVTDHIHLQAMVLVAMGQMLRGQQPKALTGEQKVITSFLLPRDGDSSRLRGMLNSVLEQPQTSGESDTVYRQIKDGHFSLSFGLDKLIRQSGLVQVKPGMVVGDIACGVGSQAADLARMVGTSGRVYAVDIDPGVIAFLQHLRKQIPQGAQIIPVKSVFDNVSLPQGSLDLAMIHRASFFFSGKDGQVPNHGYQLLTSIHRALKPGGRLLIRSHLHTSRLTKVVSQCGFRLVGKYDLRGQPTGRSMEEDLLTSFVRRPR